MPSSKLRKALGAVKDQTSISLAKVSGTSFSNLDVAILKATTHDDVPVEERFVTEVVLLTSTSRSQAAACVRHLRRRIRRTNNWLVALKSLNLVFRILQDGDPGQYFSHEVLQAMNNSRRSRRCGSGAGAGGGGGGSGGLLDLSGFRDDSTSTPWDFTAFVRLYAHYLAERLECALMGKLHHHHHRSSRTKPTSIQQPSSDHVVKPLVLTLLDKIIHWQRLLDRVLATKPTGPAKTNRMVQISLYLVVRESFEIYRDISDALALVLDNFFHLPKHACLDAFHACTKSSLQFAQLADYYAFCKSLGVGRPSEYPTVHNISDSLLETLNEFLKDTTHPSTHLRRRAADAAAESDALQKPNSNDINNNDPRLVHVRHSHQISSGTATSSCTCTTAGYDEEDNGDDELVLKDVIFTRTSVSSTTTATNQELGGSVQDLITALDDHIHDVERPEHEQRMISGSTTIKPQTTLLLSPSSSQGDLDNSSMSSPSCLNYDSSSTTNAGWEMALVESANNLAYRLNSINHRMFDPAFLDNLQLFDHQNNPFLQMDDVDRNVVGTTPAELIINHDIGSSSFGTTPERSPSLSFPAPTFCANNPDVSTLPPEADPFSSYYSGGPTQAGVGGGMEKVSSTPSVNQDLMFRNHPQFSALQHHVK